MQKGSIHPEKITHPFQLMAAWFVMLIFLVMELLAAAAKIQNPAWITPFLVISSVALSLIVMAAVFVMLTKFRPHLQGPKEYAEWLQDERRFVGKAATTSVTISNTLYDTETQPAEPSESDGLKIIREIVGYRVEVSRIPGADTVITELRKLAFKAKIYRPPINKHEEDDKIENHEAIWVGARVPARVAILAIKTVIPIWPHLKYIHLSTDAGGAPDHVHDQVYFGGATSTAIGYKLNAWELGEITAIPDNLNQLEFHRAIRAKYP